MITVNTNLASMLVQKNLKNSTNSLNLAIERLTTGFRINSAKDDAAGKSIAIDMDVKLSSNAVVQDNVSMGISMLNTAEGNVNLIKNSVQRCRDLCEQAMNGVYDSDSQNAIKAELTQLVEQINQTKSKAEFNGINLLGGTGGIEFLSDIEICNPTVLFDTNATSVEEAEAALRTVLTTAEMGDVFGISNEYGLQAFANVVNGKNGYAIDFSYYTVVLTDDIDLSSVDNWSPIGRDYKCFSGTFKGNGHTISNLKFSDTHDIYSVGLFGNVNFGTISDTGLVNVSISGNQNIVGGLVGQAFRANISNCYVTGTLSGASDVGGLVGIEAESTITNCAAAGMVSAQNGGGLVGYVDNSSVTNSVAYNLVSGIGGFAGSKFGTCTFSNNTYVDASSGHAIGTVTGLNISGITYDPTASPTPSGGSSVTLQIGLDGTENSRLTIQFGLNLGTLSSILANPANSSNLTTIDNALSSITSVETQIGANLNRLESIQDSLITQQKTLTEARSLVQDADVSKESANYIKSQILQQASASLLTVANQSPSVFLSLINGMR